jgi:hypothetical protein
MVCMGELEEVGQTSVNYSGYFDWPGLYQVITGWAKKNGMKIFETVYKDKTGGTGFVEREWDIEFRVKVDRMNMYILNVYMHLWDCQKVDVTENGETKSVERGRIFVRLTTKIDRDFQNVFEGSPFWKKTRRVYYKLKFWDWAFEHWDAWYNKMYDLQKDIKVYLRMDTA